MNDGRDQNESGNCDEQSGIIKSSNRVSSLSELTFHEKQESSPGAAENREVSGNSGNGSNFISLTPDSQLESRERNSSLTVQRPSEESIPSKTGGNSSSNEQLEPFQSHDSDHIRMSDTSETAQPVNHSVISEEISRLPGHIDLSKSPTRSSRAHNGRASSVNGVNDQSTDPHQHLPKRSEFKTQRVAEFVSTTRRPRRVNVPGNNMMNSNSEVQPHQEGKFSSMSSNEKYDIAALESANRDRDESLQPTTYGIRGKKQVNSQYSRGIHPVRNWMRSESDRFPSREPVYLRGSLAGYENGNTSNHGHNEFRHSSRFNWSDKSEYPEEDKMELLKMVDELRDQLNRSYTQRGKANGKVPHRATHQQKQRPFYDVNYPPGGYEPRKTRPQHRVFSQMPFSGKATNCGQHVDYSCWHSYDQNHQCPLQLPATGICSNKGLCRAHHSYRCYNPYSSSPASTQRSMEIPLWGGDKQSHARRQTNHEVNKLFLRERRQSIKQHCRPVAGGAPFIICHHCWKLLQLPVDFLLSRKRCHRLRCGACSEVLKFSLHGRTHIVPYTPNAMEPLSS
ncbi:hypothetical protein HHK36_016005 [Tetracentron sinense]|uniref:Probable zinc-ribbon domain-containing protein n=1 Tax=Tetracentron sinense TaxID=13715 RepID=A0A835DAL6_TETSI|nr:hypothetical protein HHK36_016005 [Tetracentron sinense]